ncbi:conserved protein of unknown function [Petrocella atlantisensis]|uniref:Ethanolamine utilization protein n=1 Tax=Petrocella atlantisensis TaxID=2173034 RepID=A0A3P7NZN5_9FIRM|nr:hypothetical protein [Petrocella atlantisensis]VDN48395.1 conserved protein of unknown function [Petrocella atlantisensis]
MNLESLDEKSLIESITKEVMKKLEERIMKSELERPIKKDKILAIAMSDYKVLYEVNDQYDVDDFDDAKVSIDISPYEVILLGSISYQELVQISMGFATSKVTTTVIEAILTGKKIFFVEEGITYSKYEDTANTNFYNMLKGYEEQVETFGIEWINANEIGRRLQDVRINLLEKAEALKKLEGTHMSQNEHVRERIITESLAKQYQKQGYERLLINKNTIITPLAKDYLRDHKIKMITT